MTGRHQIKCTRAVFITQVRLNWISSNSFAGESSLHFYLSCKDVVNKLAAKDKTFIEWRKKIQSEMCMWRRDNQNLRKNISACQNIECVELYFYACYTIDILRSNFTFNYTRINMNFWFYYSKFRIPRQVRGPEIVVHWFQVTLLRAYNWYAPSRWRSTA